MIESIACVLLFVLAATPLESVLRWLVNAQTSTEVPCIEFSRDTFLFFIAQLLSGLIAYGGLRVLERVFYYADPVFFYFGVALMCGSFFWSVFKGFQQNTFAAPFIVGIYAFFSTSFLWLYPISLLVFCLLFNQRELGHVVAALVCFLGLVWFDVGTLFFGVNAIVVAMLIIRNSLVLSQVFLGKAPTLVDLFQAR